MVVVPIYERTASGEHYNTAVVIDADGRLLPAYRKVHVPYDPLFYEKTYFLPGDRYRVYDTQYGRIAVLICYDQWFPEAARAVALMGAEIIFYPTAIGRIAGGEEPPEGDWREAWETVQRGHAIANSVHVAAVNRVGKEGDIRFFGSSFVADAFGNVIARASETDEEVLVVEVDLAENETVREGWGFFRNRRPETYGLLARRLPPGMAPRQSPATACLRSGSRTTPSGSPGPMTARRSPTLPRWRGGSTSRSSRRSAPQRPSTCSSRAKRCAPASRRCWRRKGGRYGRHPVPHRRLRRRLVPGLRADLPREQKDREPRDGELDVQRLGREVP